MCARNWLWVRSRTLPPANTVISIEAVLLYIRHLSPPSGSRGIRWAECGAVLTSKGDS